MPSPTTSKAKRVGPRFYDYLDGLREEFELQSNAMLATSTGPRRFHVYLEGLKCEFELMAEKIESLQKERDSEYREKVEKKLHDGRRFVCERCSKGKTQVGIPTPSEPQSIGIIPSLVHRPGVQSESHNPGTSSVDPSPKTTTNHSTQNTSHTPPSQSISHGTTKRSGPISADSQSFALLSSDLGTDERNWSIEFNNKVEKELDVELAHTLFHGNPIGCVKFSRDGKYLAAGCANGKAYIYDVQAGTLTCVLRNLLAEDDHIRALCFSHDGKYLATGSWDGGLYIWKITTKYVRNAFKGHTSFINSLDFSPNGRLLVSASNDNTIRLWNMHDGSVKFIIDNNPTSPDACFTCAVFSPDGRYVAASHRDGMVGIWNVCTSRLTRRMKAHQEWANCVAFMPHGCGGLVSGGWEHRVRYWDVSSLDLCAGSQTTKDSDDGGVDEQTWPEREFIGHEDSVYSLAVAPDGRWVASASRDQTVHIWDSRNAVVQCSTIHDDWVWTVEFSPTGRYLASAGRDGTVIIWTYSNVTPRDNQEQGD